MFYSRAVLTLPVLSEAGRRYEDIEHQRDWGQSCSRGSMNNSACTGKDRENGWGRLRRAAKQSSMPLPQKGAACATPSHICFWTLGEDPGENGVLDMSLELLNAIGPLPSFSVWLLNVCNQGKRDLCPLPHLMPPCRSCQKFTLPIKFLSTFFLKLLSVVEEGMPLALHCSLWWSLHAPFLPSLDFPLSVSHPTLRHKQPIQNHPQNEFVI